MGLNLLQIVLFGFMNNLASHLERSPLIHSYSYESAGDRPTCFARLPINSKSFMQNAGYLSGNFYSEDAHIVERYTLIGPEHMNYHVTINDPQNLLIKNYFLFSHYEELFIHIIEWESTHFIGLILIQRLKHKYIKYNLCIYWNIFIWNKISIVYLQNLVW